jgi:ankyrin repeat protein
MRGDVQFMMYLEARDESLNDPDHFGLPPVAYAAYYNNIEVVASLWSIESLHETNGDVLNGRGLYLACYAGNWDAVKYFTGTLSLSVFFTLVTLWLFQFTVCCWACNRTHMHVQE